MKMVNAVLDLVLRVMGIGIVGVLFVAMVACLFLLGMCGLALSGLAPTPTPVP